MAHPSQAHALIEDVRGRGAWAEVQAEVWRENGGVLNILDELGEHFVTEITLPLSTTLQCFVRPECVMAAYQLVDDYALDLAAAAYDVLGDPSVYLSWECLELMSQRFDGLADWMMRRAVWDLPCVPVLTEHCDLVDTITSFDMRMWHRVEIDFNIEKHRYLVDDGVRSDPAAMLWMRWAEPEGYFASLQNGQDLETWWESKESVARTYTDDWYRLLDVVRDADRNIAERVARPLWLTR